MISSPSNLLSDVSSRLNSDLDIDRVLADVLDLTVRRVGASNGSILIFDEGGTVVHKILARAGMPAAKAQAVIAEVLSEGLAGWVVQRQQSAIVHDVTTDPRWVSFPDDELVSGSAVGVPLLRRDRVVGVLILRHPEPWHFTRAHMALVSSIADQAVIAVENARLFYSVQGERAKMEAIINGAGDAIVVTDQQGRVLMMNAIARQAFDVPPGTDLSEQHLLEVIPNRSMAELWKNRGNAAYPSAGEIPLPDKRTYHANMTDVSGVGWVIVMQDITYLKELNDMKSDFVAAVSHDLRSPLQLILTYANLLLDSGSMTRQQRNYVDGINRGVQKMSTLIDDLLDLAKIETGIGMEREACYLHQIIIDIIERYEELIQSKGLDLQLQIPPDLPPVEANAHRVDQVVSNLIDNAVKYTTSGSITVEAFADDQQVTVHVSDTGIGLTAQEQTKLFNKFYRAQNKLTKGIEGTGLGLVIAKSIVEQYGGRIWAQSTWQKGSTFAFSLPARERA